MPEPLFRPWGTVTPEFWTASPPGAVGAPQSQAPETLRARLAKVAEVAQGGRLEDATALAAQLDQDVTVEYGEAHLHTLQVREVRGYLAALMGNHATGLSWYLHAMQLRVTIQGPKHPDVEAATRRAYSLWRAMPPDSDRQRLGTELLTIASDIHGTDSLIVRRIRERLYSLMLAPATGTAQLD
ncbi:hypothetical protein LK07_24150 [Streptomyces pluripotens]|uniref:Tetratricopeptide repeat protein n=1 Tax=Streptomyces pluripotens TaxID=1355015 RepID=A0A221P2Y0_9ACTN|nr:hypothetical protein [Streptomyces pluripotens]ARP72340.1 hypothetical protein LK06_022985 [Streptomyces pluripotens]ASN26591.1 hypothetical protein LK07_24150 [Streptomyces pluripotens]